MSAGVGQVSSIPSILAAMNSYVVVDEKGFFKNFDSENATMVATDDKGFVNAETKRHSITSFDIGDCITVFAIEKEDGKNESVICWHMGNGSSVNELIKEFESYGITNPCDIYIIGGNDSTTQEAGCLLENIREAAGKAFNEESKIILELTNPHKTTNLDYVSANLQLDGTLTLCYHDTMHN